MRACVEESESDVPVKYLTVCCAHVVLGSVLLGSLTCDGEDVSSWRFKQRLIQPAINCNFVSSLVKPFNHFKMVSRGAQACNVSVYSNKSAMESRTGVELVLAPWSQDCSATLTTRHHAALRGP